MTIYLEVEKTRVEEIAKVEDRIMAGYPSNLFISDCSVMCTIMSYKRTTAYAMWYNDFINDKISKEEYNRALSKLYLDALENISDKEYLLCVELTKAHYEP